MSINPALIALFLVRKVGELLRDPETGEILTDPDTGEPLYVEDED